MHSSRDVQNDTVEVERQYLRLTTVHGRDFQKYSIDNSIHMVPIDEVGKNADDSLSCNFQKEILKDR